jgi:cell division septation protein DedD
MEKDELGEREGLKEILEEAEILAELKEEEKIRKKNTKIIALAAIGLFVCGVVFYWAQYTPPANVSNEAPLVNGELFSEAGKIKIPGQSVKEMNDLAREPLVSDEDSLPAPPEPEPEPVDVAAVKPPLEQDVAAVKPPLEHSEPVVKKNAGKKMSTYNIRVGAFVLAGELKQAMDKVKALGLIPSAKKEKNKVNMHKVLVGPYPTKNRAQSAQNRLKGKKIKGFITRTGGNYYVHVGAFYKKDGALRMKEKVDKLGYPSKPLYQPTELLCNTLYAAYKGTLAEAEENRNLLRKKGFKKAEIVRE